MLAQSVSNIFESQSPSTSFFCGKHGTLDKASDWKRPQTRPASALLKLPKTCPLWSQGKFAANLRTLTRSSTTTITTTSLSISSTSRQLRELFAVTILCLVLDFEMLGGSSGMGLDAFSCNAATLPCDIDFSFSRAVSDSEPQAGPQASLPRQHFPKLAPPRHRRALAGPADVELH